MRTIKETIKTLSAEQVELKNQKKTVHIKGTRIMEPWQAILKHANNRSQLRELHAAYSIIRNKPIILPKKEVLNMANVAKLAQQYGEAVRISS